MNQVFAFNPRLKDSRTGKVLGKYHRGYAEPATAEQILNMFAREDLPQMLTEIRNGNEAVKDELPTVCPHYARFNNNHRAQADILPEAFTHKTCVDVDEKPLVEQAIKRAQEVNQDPLSDWEGMVEYIEYSPRKKVHIWIRIPVGMTIEEAQKAFCEEIGVPYDASCTTPERFINMTGDEVYRADSWLQPISDEEVAERREAFLNRGLDVDGRPLTPPTTTMVSKSVTVPETDIKVEQADDRTRYILQAIMKEEEITASDLNDQGARHNSVKMILSHATQLLTQAEFNGVLSEVMPANWHDQNIQQLIADFYSKYFDPNQKLTLVQKRVFRESRKIGTKQVETATDTSTPEVASQSPLSKLYASKQPPQIPANLPKLIKAATSQTPDIYKPAVSQAVFPALATYPRQLKFIYIDNLERELRINCLAVAVTGGGKDTSIRQPLQHILADMKKRDEANRTRLIKFNEEFNSKASTTDKPKRPVDLIIQTIKSDITRAALVQRMDEAQGAPLYVKINEIEQWDKIEGVAGTRNQFTTLKLIDDEDNDFGADRAGTQSVTASGSLHLNWNANTTIQKAQKYFRNVLNDGPLSRLCLATIPEPEIGADIPVFGRYDEKYDEALRPFIENLKTASGVINCKQARKLARQLKAECAEFARLSQDRVFDNLTHRALVHAFRKACLLYVANGMKWEKAIEDFCRWSLHYDIWIKLKLWGDLIRKADECMETSKRGPQNLLEQVPTDKDGVFTYHAVVAVRTKNGLKEEGTRNMLSQWKSRGYILQMTDDSFKKAK